jgi:hypothetical protein
MKNITVVTTFHQKGLELYGQRFLDSFAKNVDKKIKIKVYAENCAPINPDADQIEIIDATTTLEKLSAFKNTWKNVPYANGDISKHPAKEKRKDWDKAFKWDAVRFANKVYAVFDACNRNQGWVVWMDADTFVHSTWSYDQFKSLLPDENWITYVGRGKGSQTWPECGFYGLNLDSNVCQKFLKKFEDMYDNAEHGIFTLLEWHDSFVFGHILNLMKHDAPNVLDYSAEMYLREARTGGGGHPLINSKLGTWIDHMKGDRKHTGKSKTSDIIVNRNEEYWRSK